MVVWASENEEVWGAAEGDLAADQRSSVMGQFFSVSVDGRWPVTIDADATATGTWSWAPASGWHTLAVTATDAVNNTSAQTRFEFGVGSARRS